VLIQAQGGVGRHGIPHIIGFEQGHAQYQLTAFYPIGMNVFVDGAFVGIGDVA
jgi:hypothetical protein